MKQIIYTLLFVLMLLIPNAVFGQIDRDQAKAMYEKTQARGYDTDPSGFAVDTAFSASDSIAKIMILLDREKTKYKTMEEAAMDVNRLLNAVSEDKAMMKKNNGGLGFKITQRRIINKEKDKIAKDVWEETIDKKAATVEDFAKIYERFGDKPTYYINGYEVGQIALNKLRESEVLTREYRITNTASGNPNGEIWYEITPKAAYRIKLDEMVADVSVTTPTESTLIIDNIETEAAVADDDIVIEVVEPELESDSKIEVKTPKTETTSTKKRSVKRVKENINNK